MSIFWENILTVLQGFSRNAQIQLSNKEYKKVALLRLRFGEVQVFLESTLIALRGFNRNAKVELS